jgi:putative ABC transport system permease protein
MLNSRNAPMARKTPRFLQLPWRSRAKIARDVDTELSFHLDMRATELVTKGLTPDDARRQAREEFGDLEFTRAYCRDADTRGERAIRAADRVAEWGQDARYALRTLARSPGFAAVSLLTLALAIGANTAIFSVARAVLLKPLPYGAPESLVALFESWPGMPGETTPMSPANFVDYQSQQRSFTDIAAYEGMGDVVWRPENGDPVSLSALAVAPNLFHVLQVDALHGRTFAPGDETPGNDLKVVISYGAWQRLLGGDSARIGRRITLNGRPYALIGVMPPTFTLAQNVDVWVPLSMSAALADVVRARRQHYVHAIGRLKPGMNVERAIADLTVIARRLEAQYPDANTGRSAMIVPLHESMEGRLRPALLLLQAAAGMVLLIACANLANLTLSRTMGRRREMALRAALGAGRARLVRHVLTESILLAIFGGAAGVALAVVATRTLLALNPDTLPSTFSAGVDSLVVLFSAGLSMMTGVLFGLVPALDAARASLHDSLKEGGRGGGTGRGAERVRRGLVVAQVGLAVMLLVAAGLLVRSFGELTRTALGFDPDRVLTASLRAAGERYDSSGAVNRFYDDVLGEIARGPGVVAVAASYTLPSRGSVGTSIRVEGEPIDENNLPDLRYVSIRGDYFKAMRIPLKAGRVYNASDLPDGPKTAIINETAARQFFPRGDAVGRRIRIGPNPNGAWMTIVGVAGDVRTEGLDLPARPTLFANHRQETWERSMSVVIRTVGDPQNAAATLRRATKDADPALAIRDVKTLNAVVGSSLAPRRFALGLASSFAALALMLAAVGIYGVLAYLVAARTREFGVRRALGATPGSVLLLVARQGFAWSIVGLALGIAGALAGGRLLAGMLYGVTQLDAWTYVSVAVGLLLVVATACLVPAVRATRVDPLTSMRAE